VSPLATAHRQPSPNTADLLHATHISAPLKPEPVDGPPLPSPCPASSLTLTGALPATEHHLIVPLDTGGRTTTRDPSAMSTSGCAQHAAPPGRLDQTWLLGWAPTLIPFGLLGL
jgi:hypothetical protein